MKAHARLQVQGSGTEDKRANARTGAVAEMNGWRVRGAAGSCCWLIPKGKLLALPYSILRRWEVSLGNSCGTANDTNVNKRNCTAASNSHF